METAKEQENDWERREKREGERDLVRRVLRRWREKVVLPLFLGPHIKAMGIVVELKAMAFAASIHESDMKM